jgi:hypothetical protein
LRIGLALLALLQLVIGGWNLLWPESFYLNVPTVDLTPPFSEHYARDFGGATAGLGVVLAAAAIKPRPNLVVPALLAMSVFAVPHLIFHAGHLHDAAPSEAALLITGLSIVAVLPLALLVITIFALKEGLSEPPHDQGSDVVRNSQ